MNPPTSGSTSIDPTAMKQGAHLRITTAGCGPILVVASGQSWTETCNMFSHEKGTSFFFFHTTVNFR